MTKISTLEIDRSGLKFHNPSWGADQAPIPAKRLSRANSDGSPRNRCPNLAVANGYFVAKPYSVNCYGSHPDEGNDDCWCGDDFETFAQAEAAAANWQEIAGNDATNTAYVEIIAWTGHVVKGLLEYEQISVKKVATDAQIRRRARRERDDDRAWQREIAMEAGMGLGIDAYNDAMGWS